MDPENIAAIAIAGISAISSVFTFAYFKYNSSFGDKQRTEVTLTSEIYNPENGHLFSKKTVKIDMDNKENYEIDSVKLANGKESIEATTTKKPSDQPYLLNNLTEGHNNLSELSNLLEEEPQMKLTATTTSKKGNEEVKKSTEEIIQISDLQAVLDNNAKGDAQITEARQYTLFHTANVWLASVKEDYNFLKQYLGVGNTSLPTDLSGQVLEGEV